MHFGTHDARHSSESAAQLPRTDYLVAAAFKKIHHKGTKNTKKTTESP
jgi:hypothetical protein